MRFLVQRSIYTANPKPKSLFNNRKKSETKQKN